MTREEAINEIKSWAIPSRNGREVLETLIPELTESEDERIRKFLIQHISEWIGCIEHDLKNSSKDIESEKELAMFKAGLAYLEKQKESLHIPETCKENANSFIDGIIEVRSFQRGMEEGRRLEKQKEQKQAQTSDEKEYIRTIKSIISDFIRDKKPENLAYYQRIYDWLDGRHVPFSCGHEKGQPAEKQDYSELNDLERAILRGFLAAGVENVPIGIIKDTASECVGFLALTESEPVEWSEEDEGELQNAIDALEFLGKKGVYRSESGYDAALQAASWLKNLPERFNLQPKQEWSEEDEEMMTDIIESLEYAYPNDNEFRIAWLKSLRPSWKPSEEQMEALKNSAYGAYQNGDGPALRELYEQLEKL